MKEIKITNIIIIGLFLVGTILFITQELRGEVLPHSDIEGEISKYIVD